MFLGISFGKLPWWITRSLSLKNNKKIKSFKNHFVDQNLFDNYLRRIGDTGVKSKLKHSQNGREDCHSQNHWNARWSRHVWLSKKNSLEKIRGIDWFRSDLFVYPFSVSAVVSGAMCFGLFSKQTQLNLNKYLYCRDSTA